jgi:hypothetical protein
VLTIFAKGLQGFAVGVVIIISGKFPSTTSDGYGVFFGGN